MTVKGFIHKYQKILLFAFSVMIFALQNSFLSWITFTPLLLLIKKLDAKSSFVTGGLYGLLSYTFYALWLIKFSLPSLLLVEILYFILCGLLCEVLYFALKLPKKIRPFILLLILVFYEYIKTKGFAGFSYGLTAYTQWKNLYIIQIADLGGVYTLCALMDLFSVLVFECLDSAFSGFFSKRELVYIIIFQIIFTGNILYGFCRVQRIDARDKNLPKAKIALIQHNPDTSKTDFDSYKMWVQRLEKLTLAALYEEKISEGNIENSEKISLVVWPETAVIPSIRKSLNDKNQSQRKEMTYQLLDFIAKTDTSFLIGNFDRDGEEDYNAAFFFNKNIRQEKIDALKAEYISDERRDDYDRASTRENEDKISFFSSAQVYRKIHLVPFSECLPFGIKFPSYSAYAEKKNNMLWSKGKERKVFELERENTGEVLKFSSPICFEDTFGRDCREFYKAGARAFISIGNDAWAKSKRCQKEHLKIAVFRSVENHLPSARCSASGESCFISSSGRIYGRAESFKENYVVSEIPILP